MLSLHYIGVKNYINILEKNLKNNSQKIKKMLNNRDKEVGLITNSSFFSRIESEEIDSKHSKKMNFDFLKKMSRGISNKMENNDKLYEF